MNLVAFDSFKLCPEVDKATAKAKHIVTFFRQTIAASDMLKKLQMDANSKHLRLIQEVDTRWNSKFHMIDRFIEIAPFVAVAITKFRKAPAMLSGNEMEMLSEMRNVLLPLETATKIISSENSMSAAKVIPTAHCICKQIERVEVSNEIASDLKSAVLVKLKERTEEIDNNNILTISTALDPRFKNAYFSNRYRNQNDLLDLLKNGK